MIRFIFALAIMVLFSLPVPLHAQGVAGPDLAVNALPIRIIDSRAALETRDKSGDLGLYMTIQNNGDNTDRLISATTSDGKNNAHFVTTLDEQGTVIEIKQDSIALPPRSNLQISPGGVHIVFPDIGVTTQPGQSFSVNLTFERAGMINLEVPIIDASEIPQPEQSLLR